METERRIACKNISQIQTARDIIPLSPAGSPGSHCPLFGVVMSAAFLQDLVVLVIGEGECCWNAYHQFQSQGGKGRFYTYSMDNMDIIYGAREKISVAVKKLYEMEPFRAIMLVSSCVPELIGEDLERIAAKCNLPVPVLCAHTSHYNSTGYMQGITNFYSGLLPLIQPPSETKNIVSILGARYDGVECSEIPRLIADSGFEVFTPSNMDEIMTLSECRLTLVADVTSLGLARKLYETYRVPYVRIDRLCCPQRIVNAYQQIEKILGVALLQKAEPFYKELIEQIETVKVKCSGKRFVFAVPFLLPFETTEFLCMLGMRPTWIAARDLYEGESETIRQLVEQKVDCPVSPFTSLKEISRKCPDLDTDLYFGFLKSTDQLPDTVAHFNPGMLSALTGFSLPARIVTELTRLL